MKTAESAKKSKLKDQAKMLIDQIQNEGSESENDTNENEPAQKSGLFNSSSKFGGSSGRAANLIDKDHVLQAAKDMFQKQQENQHLLENQYN